MSMEDVNQALHATVDPSSSSLPLERRSSGEEDPAAMTIEFLRARLLSERSVSKAARERAQLLSMKVSELEERLEAEIQLRKKLEADRLEILLKYREELSEEYGDFFASSMGEGFPRDESTLDSPNSRKHDTNEEFASCTLNQDGEGLAKSRLDQLDRSDSSQQLSRDEANDDDDDETDYSGREKGVISWGKRNRSRKEFGYGTDWLGRNFSQRSLTSTDGESPQKKWAGKSVRHIRKRESRSYGTNGKENRETQAFEQGDVNIGEAAAMRERLPCEDERDTEVERVLERQAELIEQFEAEENAQRAWEAKFKEGKELSNHENVLIPSNSENKLEAVASSHSIEEGFMDINEATKPLASESTLPNNSSNGSVIRHSRKVHPEDISKGIQEGSVQPESKKTSQDIDEAMVPFQNNAACSNVNQVKAGISDGEPFRAEKGTEGMEACEVLNDDLLHGQVSSMMDAKQSTEQSSVEIGKKSKYKKHLSSSFRFAVFPDAEPVAGSSPHMPGFTSYKEKEDKTEEPGELNGSRGASAFSDAHHHHAEDYVASAVSVNDHVGANSSPPMGDSPTVREDTESQERGKDTLNEVKLGIEKPRSHSISEIDARDSAAPVDSSPQSLKDEENRRMKGLEGEQDSPSVQGMHLSELSSYIESRGPGGIEYMQPRYYPGLPPPPDYGFRPSVDLDRANFNNVPAPMYSGIKSGIHVPGLHGLAYEEAPSYRSQHRSLDGLDRVADVLRALEIAKFQVQSSNEQDVLLDANDHDGGDPIYPEPPRFPSTYAAPPQPYAISAPYLSRAPAPYMHNMHGWRALSSGYGVGSSRQVANAPYMHYPQPRVPETRNMWLPPSSGVNNSNMYHYDTSQHR